MHLNKGPDMRNWQQPLSILFHLKVFHYTVVVIFMTLSQTSCIKVQTSDMENKNKKVGRSYSFCIHIDKLIFLECM